MDVSQVQFKLIDSSNTDTDDMKPGEAIVYDYGDGSFGLILCCPQCGKTSSSATGGHKYNKETQSVTPSIVHDVKLGGCGWHGHLTNGKFTNA